MILQAFSFVLWWLYWQYCEWEVGAVLWCFLAVEGGGATEEGTGDRGTGSLLTTPSRGKLHHHAQPRPLLTKPVIWGSQGKFWLSGVWRLSFFAVLHHVCQTLSKLRQEPVLGRPSGEPGRLWPDLASLGHIISSITQHPQYFTHPKPKPDVYFTSGCCNRPPLDLGQWGKYCGLCGPVGLSTV